MVTMEGMEGGPAYSIFWQFRENKEESEINSIFDLNYWKSTKLPLAERELQMREGEGSIVRSIHCELDKNIPVEL